jgi:AraC-like DNA-binding protein
MASDTLSQILNMLRMKGTIYFHTHCTPSWSVLVPAYRHVARFHLAISGTVWVRIVGEREPLQLLPGDLVVIPHGRAHVLSDHPEREPLALDEVIAKTGYAGSGALSYGGSGATDACQLFCGHFEFDEGAIHPILSALPNSIHVPNSEGIDAAWIDMVMRFIRTEVHGGRAGAEAIVHRLTEIVFIQGVRSFVNRSGDAAGCLAGVLDPQLGMALSAIHLAPQRPWTVEAMAREARMSRTVFAERFSALIGMTPLGYVTHWRMQIARRELVEGGKALAHIAEAAGYRSESAFARAFKREMGLSPGMVRRDN